MNNPGSTNYRLVEKIKIFFGISQDPALVTLLNAARSDVSVQEKLFSVTSQPSFQRHAPFGLWRQELSLKRAPRVLIKALGALQDDRTAEKAGDILNETGD